jgi:hypothetical protein
MNNKRFLTPDCWESIYSFLLEKKFVEFSRTFTSSTFNNSFVVVLFIFSCYIIYFLIKKKFVSLFLITKSLYIFHIFFTTFYYLKAVELCLYLVTLIIKKSLVSLFHIKSLKGPLDTILASTHPVSLLSPLVKFIMVYIQK